MLENGNKYCSRYGLFRDSEIEVWLLFDAGIATSVASKRNVCFPAANDSSRLRRSFV